MSRDHEEERPFGSSGYRPNDKHRLEPGTDGLTNEHHLLDGLTNEHHGNRDSVGTAETSKDQRRQSNQTHAVSSLISNKMRHGSSASVEREIERRRRRENHARNEVVSISTYNNNKRHESSIASEKETHRRPEKIRRRKENRNGSDSSKKRSRESWSKTMSKKQDLSWLDSSEDDDSGTVIVVEKSSSAGDTRNVINKNDGNGSGNKQKRHRNTSSHTRSGISPNQSRDKSSSSSSSRSCDLATSGSKYRHSKDSTNDTSPGYAHKSAASMEKSSSSGPSRACDMETFGSTDRHRRGSTKAPASSSSLGMSRWQREKPGRDEPRVREFDGILYYWCELCNKKRGLWSPHTTNDHRMGNFGFISSGPKRSGTTTAKLSAEKSDINLFHTSTSRELAAKVECIDDQETILILSDSDDDTNNILPQPSQGIINRQLSPPSISTLKNRDISDSNAARNRSALLGTTSTENPIDLCDSSSDEQETSIHGRNISSKQPTKEAPPQLSSTSHQSNSLHANTNHTTRDRKSNAIMPLSYNFKQEMQLQNKSNSDTTTATTTRTRDDTLKSGTMNASATRSIQTNPSTQIQQNTSKDFATYNSAVGNKQTSESTHHPQSTSYGNSANKSAVEKKQRSHSMLNTSKVDATRIQKTQSVQTQQNTSKGFATNNSAVSTKKTSESIHHRHNTSLALGGTDKSQSFRSEKNTSKIDSTKKTSESIHHRHNISLALGGTDKSQSFRPEKNTSKIDAANISTIRNKETFQSVQSQHNTSRGDAANTLVVRTVQKSLVVQNTFVENTTSTSTRQKSQSSRPQQNTSKGDAVNISATRTIDRHNVSKGSTVCAPVIESKSTGESVRAQQNTSKGDVINPAAARTMHISHSLQKTSKSDDTNTSTIGSKHASQDVNRSNTYKSTHPRRNLLDRNNKTSSSDISAEGQSVGSMDVTKVSGIHVTRDMHKATQKGKAIEGSDIGGIKCENKEPSPIRSLRNNEQSHVEKPAQNPEIIIIESDTDSESDIKEGSTNSIGKTDIVEQAVNRNPNKRTVSTNRRSNIGGDAISSTSTSVSKIDTSNPREEIGKDKGDRMDISNQKKIPDGGHGIQKNSDAIDKLNEFSKDSTEKTSNSPIQQNLGYGDIKKPCSIIMTNHDQTTSNKTRDRTGALPDPYKCTAPEISQGQYGKESSQLCGNVIDNSLANAMEHLSMIERGIVHGSYRFPIFGTEKFLCTNYIYYLFRQFHLSTISAEEAISRKPVGSGCLRCRHCSWSFYRSSLDPKMQTILCEHILTGCTAIKVTTRNSIEILKKAQSNRACTSVGEVYKRVTNRMVDSSVPPQFRESEIVDDALSSVSFEGDEEQKLHPNLRLPLMQKINEKKELSATGLPSLKFTAKNNNGVILYDFVVTVGPSLIPNSGYGVFLRLCRVRRVSKKKSLTLTRLPLVMTDQNGKDIAVFLTPERIHDDADCNDENHYVEDDSIQFSCHHQGCGQIDLGKYGPFVQPHDDKWEMVYNFKNFIFDFEPARWSYDYDKTLDDGRPMVLDITDDATGETHTQATENIPMYVNEVGHNKNLKESVVPIEGEDEISYRLCLEEPISVGESIELLVNYGDMYEDTRERHGYGKSSGGPDQLERDKVRLNQSERVQMERFVFELSMEELHDLLVALKRIIDAVISATKKSEEIFVPDVMARQWTARFRLHFLEPLFRKRYDMIFNNSNNASSSKYHAKIRKLLRSMKMDMDASLNNIIQTSDVVREIFRRELFEENFFACSKAGCVIHPLDPSMWCPISRDLTLAIAKDISFDYRLGNISLDDAINRVYSLTESAGQKIKDLCNAALDAHACATSQCDLQPLAFYKTPNEKILGHLKRRLICANCNEEPYLVLQDANLIRMIKTSSDIGKVDIVVNERRIDKIDMKWYLLWQVLRVSHFMATKTLQLKGSVYSFKKLCSSVGIDITDANQVIALKMDEPYDEIYTSEYGDNPFQSIGSSNKKGKKSRGKSVRKVANLSKKARVKRSLPLYEDCDGTLPEGWKIEYSVRKTGASAGHIDRYWFTPDGKKIRSRNEVKRYLDLLNANANLANFKSK